MSEGQPPQSSIRLYAVGEGLPGRGVRFLPVCRFREYHIQPPSPIRPMANKLILLGSWDHRDAGTKSKAAGLKESRRIIRPLEFWKLAPHYPWGRVGPMKKKRKNAMFRN